MLLDNTPSMGLGATAADMNSLIAATSTRCAFACHEASTSGVENPNSNYMIARQIGITLRMDVLQKAVQAMIASAQTAEGSSSLFRFAAYSFGQAALEPRYQIARLVALTSDPVSTKKAVGDMSLMTTPHSSYNDDALTSFDTALTKIGDEIKTDGGSGGGINDRQAIVMMITDGVGNSLKPSGCTGLFTDGNYRCIEPIDVRYCQTLKQRNIKIAILYTTYVPVSDHLYDAYVSKFVTQIGPKLQQCASPGLYSEVNADGDMLAALQKLFQKSSSSIGLRLAS